jgi:hypothetical protein
VPLAPRSAHAFANALDGLASAETEITYLPEYYYWDGVEPTSAGCAFGGALHFEPDDAEYAFAFDQCAFTRNFTLTGAGSYHPDKDRFVMAITLTGRWQCELKYVRVGDKTRVTGECDGNKVVWEG